MKCSLKRKYPIHKRPIPKSLVGRTYLDPKFDPGFKAFFDSEDTLKNFLNALLNLKGNNRIHKISYNTEHEVIFRTPHKKIIKFDIYATTGTRHFFDIEMQKAGDTYFVDRTILNKAFLVIKAKIAKDRSNEFKALPKEERKKRRYELPETISIWLCDFELPGCNNEILDEWAIYSKNNIKKGVPIPISNKNRYIMVSLPHFKKRKSEVRTALDKWLFLLNNAGESDNLPNYGKTYNEAIERIKIDNADDRLLKAQETSMSSTKETMDIIMAGKIVDARNKRSLEVAHNLYNKGVDNNIIAETTGVPTSTIRRWKRKTV